MVLSEMLQSLFEEKGASLNNISRLSGINKGTLHRIIYGKQDVKFDELMKISCALGLSSGEQRVLFDSYFNGVYGEREMNAVHFIVREGPKAYEPLKVDVPEKGLDGFPKDGFLPNIAKVYEAIVSATDIDSGKIYTNFSFENERLDEFFFRKAQQKGIELVHVVKNIQKDGEIENIRVVIRSLRYMNIGQFPYVFDSRNKEDIGQLLPYYVVTEKFSVLFNDSFGYITNGSDANGRVKENVEKTVQTLTRFGTKPESLLDMRNMWFSGSFKDGYTAYCRYPCVAKYLTRDAMHAAAKDMPGIDKLIEMCYSYYSDLFNSDSPGFFTAAGIENFVRTGNFYEIPAMFTDGFLPKARVEMLTAMKEDIKNGRVLILNSNDGIPDGMDIGVFRDAVLLTGTDASQPNFTLSDGYIYKTADPYYVKLMHIMGEYIVACGYVCKTETALRIVDNCIAAAENL